VDRDLTRLLSPKAVAVIGASPKPGSVGGEVLRNLRRCGFAGAVLPVNPKYRSVDDLPCYPAVGEIPAPVDLAVVAINHDLVLGEVESCAHKGIRNLVIITAGFKESGAAGAERESLLREAIHRHSLNVVGPNCMGIINSSPSARLNASFSRWFPQAGGIAFVSQSGSLGETLLECFGDAGLGVSLFINLGNRAGLSENDFLAHLEADPGCSAIFLYLESFAEPRGFRDHVERISRTKPVVVLKAGRTKAGAAAVASHTGSLASPDAIVEAFLNQCGAIRVTTMQETLTALRAMERGVLPRGRRVVILTNAGGAGIIAADACERVGIDVPPLGEEAKRRLATFLPAEAGLGNPIDMIATAGADDYRGGLEVGLSEADAAIVVFRPPIVLKDSPEVVATRIIEGAATSPDKPVLVCTLSEQSTPATQRLRAARLPVYAMPETAVDALAVLDRARRIRESWQAPEVPRSFDSARARKVIDRVLREGRSGLFFEEGAEILAAYEIPVCAFTYVSDEDDAPAAAAALGYPLVAKIDSPHLMHRFERGAVLTGIADEGELRRAVGGLCRVARQSGLADARILLQETRRGRELIYGVKRDPDFGPVAMFGLGGTFVEALHDVAFSVAPVNGYQAMAAIRSIRSFRLLEAFRGDAPNDLEALASLLTSLSRLALDLPEVSEIDLNPVIARARSTAAVDILIKLEAESLRVEPMNLPGKRNDLTDVRGSANPRHDALETHSKS
jgi:acyl-CoA synthetase (NDP forming)